MSGCEYLDIQYETNKNDINTFTDYLYLADLVRDDLGNALNLTEKQISEANFMNMQDYADVLTCREFEGHQMPWTFTEETYKALH